ncbi:MAG: VWA domain-containing protein [Planktothrix sp.]
MEKTQIFIIDVSGSMNSPFNRSKTLRRENQSSTLFSKITHIEAAKQYLATAIINLANQSPATQLIIISFAETSSIVYHGNVSNLNQIKQVINSLQANGGGTNLASAFQLVLNFLSSEKNVTVIRSIDIITDGLANNEGENPEILDYILLKKFAAMFYRDLYCSYCYLDKRFKIALKIVGNDDNGKIEIIDYCNQKLLDTSRKTDVEKDYLFRFRVLVFLIPILFVTLYILLYLFFFREQPNKNPLPSLPVGSSSKLAEIIESLPEGIMAYSCPNEMTVGITDTCTVRIANNEYLSSFQDALTDRRRKFLEDTLNDGTKKNFERVELNYVSSEMTVKIIAKNFKIYPQEKGESQPIIDNDFTSWQWDITPKKSGIQKIKFTASVILEVPGYQKTIPKHYEEQVVEVQVKVNPSYSITSFIENNWQYLTAVFVVSSSLGIVLLVWHKRKPLMVSQGDTYNTFGQAGNIGRQPQSVQNTFAQSHPVKLEERQLETETRREIMVEGDTYNLYNSQAGAVGKESRSDYNTFMQSNEADYQNLRIEVSKVIDSLVQENASDSKIIEELRMKIKYDVTFKERLISAFKAGGVEAIKAIFNHPVINVPIEMVKGFIEAEAQK